MDVNTNIMTDEMKWIKEIKKKANEQAANKLIQKYYNEIFGFVYKQTFDQELTKDITQDIFVSMLKTIHGFNGRASFRTWLYKIANSRIIDHYRSKYYKQNKKTESIDGKIVRGSTDFTKDVEIKDEVDNVIGMLSRFDWDLQRIVRLKVYGEYTFYEIATSLAIPESTVKTKYYSAIRKLNKLLKEDEDEK